MRPSKTALVALALLALGLSGIWLLRKDLGHSPDHAKVSEPAGSKSTLAPPAASDLLSPAFDSFGGKPTPDEAKRALADLRRELTALPKDEAVAKIRGFLASGKDRDTGLSFVISRDGKLTEWPSFRSFLLDTLISIDPAAAAVIGRELLAKPSSADEWALALRNVARGESSEDRAFLQAKTLELINNPEWQAKPSIGYLNAFDVLVHTEATSATPVLSGLIQRKDRKDLAHAAFLTVDRLVQRQPADELARLSADKALQQSRPEMVAQQFARADLRDPVQQALVKGWLLDPARSATELRAFAGVYPNNNRFVSNNLLTAEKGQSGAELAIHDQEALALISTWAADPAFAKVKEPLRAMISRLEGFVGTRTGSPSPSE